MHIVWKNDLRCSPGPLVVQMRICDTEISTENEYFKHIVK